MMWLSSFQIKRAVQALRAGRVISYPTESVFGFGCDPKNLDAIHQILDLKHRSADKGLILVASNIRQLEPWVEFDKVQNFDVIKTDWPGHETWIIPCSDNVSPLLRGTHHTLAVRVSAHPVVQALCDTFDGAITSTSANRQGQPEQKTSRGVRMQFHDSVPFYLGGDTGNHLRPSRIRDAITGKTLRE